MRTAARLLILATAALPALAVDWYVDPAAPATGTGASTAPLPTFAAAIPKAHAGDRILLKAGATHRVTASLSVPSGVTVTGYGTGALPELTASQVVATPSAWSRNAAVRTGACAGTATD